MSAISESDPAATPDVAGSRAAPRVRVRSDRVPIGLLFGIACGGVAGALARYLVELALPARTGRFPIGTFVVNLSGCALLGFLLVAVSGRFVARPLLRATLGTGLIGAYTTFSTFSVEADLLVRAGAVPLAAIYVVLSVVLGLVAGLLGMGAARRFVRTTAQPGHP